MYNRAVLSNDDHGDGKKSRRRQDNLNSNDTMAPSSQVTAGEWPLSCAREDMIQELEEEGPAGQLQRTNSPTPAHAKQHVNTFNIS